ncbi:MAG: hypothetical protein AB8I56_07635, partial [Anaerolineales bacterium]
NSNVESIVNMEAQTLPSLDLTENVLIQIWDTRGQLRLTNYEQDPDHSLALQSPNPPYRSVYLDDWHLRVLTVPLELGSRQIAILQLATSLFLVDRTLNLLVTVLFMGSVIAMAIAGVVGWLTTRRALSPLESVTQTALRITRADDLSRRISYQGPPDDEV